MQTKTRKLFMGLVGAYLVYTGIQLINSVMAGNPKNKVLFIICGGVFVLFGAFTVIYNIVQYIKESKAEPEKSDDAEEPGEEIVEPEDAEETEEDEGK